MDDYDIYRMNLLAHAIIELNEKAGHVIDPDLEERIRIAFKHIFDEKDEMKMETNSCLKKHCYACEEFKVTKNEFDKTFICSCILYRKGIVVPDITLITPAVMLNSINWEDIK